VGCPRPAASPAAYTDRVRILHLTDRSSERGGADIHLLGVVEAQRERGHDVLLVVGRDDGTAAHRCPVAVLPGLDDTQAASAAVVAAMLDRVALGFGPHVVHVHNAVAPAALEWAASRAAVATVQDHRGFCPGRGKLTLAGAPCREPMSRTLCTGCFTDARYHDYIHGVTDARLAALRRMARVIVLSAYMAAELAVLGVRAAVVPPFVHGFAADATADGEPCVLFAGRLVEAKGVRDAVAAWRDASLDLPLVFAGTGPLRGELEPEHTILGWLPHARMAAVYRRARVLVMPPRWQEPFGIAGLEALSLGVPVAAWKSGGVAEWHPGDDLLVEWGDVDALTLALCAAIDRPVGAPRGFEREALMDRLDAVYAEIV
jgi:glycosyltransferase involved in cell wall biosynthesis